MKKQKQHQPKTNKKNLRRRSVVISAQTEWHLREICARNGWGDKDIGRAIDKVMRAYLADQETRR